MCELTSQTAREIAYVISGGCSSLKIWTFCDPYALFLLPPANEVWGKVIFSEACVKNFIHRRGVLPQCMLGYHHPAPGTRQVHPPHPRHQAGTPLGQAGTPQTRHPPGTTPPDQAGTPLPPTRQSMLGDMVNKWAVCILLECNLGFTLFWEGSKKNSNCCIYWILQLLLSSCLN